MESRSSGGKPKLQPAITEKAKPQPADTQLSGGRGSEEPCPTSRRKKLLSRAILERNEAARLQAAA
jgi:hypothetical protein